jgi:hypothetical protein
MAKAKKKDGETTEAKAPKAAASPAKKAAKSPAKAKAPAKAAAPAATPMVNTSLAAESAARMIGAKASGFGASSATSDKKETSAFKQLKQAMAKPHGASVGNMLNSTTSQAAKKTSMPFQSGKQVGHNQTFGADVSRSGVPRRTGG